MKIRLIKRKRLALCLCAVLCLSTLPMASNTAAAAGCFPILQEAEGTQDSASLSLDADSIILSKGFSQTLLVTDADSDVTFSSSDPSVAAVSTDGIVTAKSVGKTTITAATADASASCQVTVMANSYTRIRMKISDCPDANAYIEVYKISYTKKGSLVLKTAFLNNRGYTIKKLKNVKIKVKNSDGKTIGTYTLKSKKVSIAQGKIKTYTFQIKKASLKIKTKQDLRLASVTPSWSYVLQR